MAEILALRSRRCELLLLRWRLLHGRIQCDPEVIPAAVDWIDSELVGMHP